MRTKGDVDRYILWFIILLILLMIVLALFYSNAIEIIRKIAEGAFV